MTPLIAWLIERPLANQQPPTGPMYWAEASHWTFEVEKARRFDSRSDAEKYMDDHGISIDAKAVEHGWAS